MVLKEPKVSFTMEIFALFLGIYLGSSNKVEQKYDLRSYYDKPYCEKQKVGNEMIKKCYKVIEVKE